MTVIVSSFGQIEQGVHYIRKYLIYSINKEFLECAVIGGSSGGGGGGAFQHVPPFWARVGWAWSH